MIVAVVGVVALAVIAGFFLLRGGGTSDNTFAQVAARPSRFKYPNDFRARRLDGGVALNKPTYQVGFGIDADNYLLASTYKLGFTVQDDGSATGPKGQQLTPNQIDHDIDVTIAKLATAGRLRAEGRASRAASGRCGRASTTTRSPTARSRARSSSPCSGSTEYYVTCQSSPRERRRASRRRATALLATFAPA